jgi:predicted dehydrogenase
MNPKYRVVIAGCGVIGGLHEDSSNPLIYSHGRAFSDNASFEIVGCIDSDIHKAKKFSQKYGIRSFGTNIEELINETKPNIVSVCTPDSTHYEIVMTMLSKGGPELKLIFLEKPACETLSDFSDMIRRSNDLNIPIIVNMSRRYHTWYKWIKENYDRRQLGRLLRADILYYGGWNHNGVHAVDIVHFLFGERLTDGQIFESWPGPQTNDPTYSARFETNNGETVVWFHGFPEEHYQVFDCDFKFTTSRLQICNFEETLYRRKAVVNALGETVLVTDITDLPKTKTSPITEAVRVIEEYLNFLSKERLMGYLLQDTASTMNAVWELNKKSNA